MAFLPRLKVALRGAALRDKKTRGVVGKRGLRDAYRRLIDNRKVLHTDLNAMWRPHHKTSVIAYFA